MRTNGSLSAASARKRILILDDHPLTRHGVAQLINHEPDLMVCGEAAAAHQALAAIPELQPDLVLADITMPGKSGLEFIKDLRGLHPKIAVLVMSMHEETLYAERVVRAGGRGYVMKSEGGEKVLEAIRQVVGGQIYLSPNVSSLLLTALSQGRTKDADNVFACLTDREFEVFQLIGQGLSTSEIASRLNLSVKTVGTHRVHIKEKLKLRTGTELVKSAVRWATTQQSG